MATIYRLKRKTFSSAARRALTKPGKIKGMVKQLGDIVSRHKDAVGDHSSARFIQGQHNARINARYGLHTKGVNATPYELRTAREALRDDIHHSIDRRLLTKEEKLHESINSKDLYSRSNGRVHQTNQHGGYSDRNAWRDLPHQRGGASMVNKQEKDGESFFQEKLRDSKDTMKRRFR